MFAGTHNVRTKAMSELLIHQRLDILQKLKEQEQLIVEVVLVCSEENRANCLTRVPKRWLGEASSSCPLVGTVGQEPSMMQCITEIHG